MKKKTLVRHALLVSFAPKKKTAKQHLRPESQSNKISGKNPSTDEETCQVASDSVV